jgi:hypothetical protein
MSSFQKYYYAGTGISVTGNAISIDNTVVTTTRTVNGHALSSNVTVTASDVSALAISNNLSDVGSVSTARGNLGLGTAATKNTGTSGATVPLLNGSNTFSGQNTFSDNLVVGDLQFNRFDDSSGNPCVDNDGNTNLLFYGYFKDADGVRSIDAASLRTLYQADGNTISVDWSGTANASAALSFTTVGLVSNFAGNLSLKGSTSGTTIFKAPAAAGGTVTLPSATGTLVGTGDTGSVTNTMLAGSIGNAKLTNSTITINGTSVSLGGSRTLSLASSDFANQGTATTVLHGNASGNPSFGAVTLTTDVTGTLPIGNGGTGITSFGTGVATALGNNVNGAGGFHTSAATVFNGITLPASYTSGGIPYASSTSAVSSSGLLAANAIVIGGGAGAAPSTTTTGTGVLTALGNAVNASGGLATSSVRLRANLAANQAIPLHPTLTTTTAYTANRACYAVYFVNTTISSLAITFNVSSAGAAGKVAKVVMYDLNSDGTPGTVIASSGTVAIDSTGDKTVTITTSQTTPAREYIFALVSDGAPTITCCDTRYGFNQHGMSNGASQTFYGVYTDITTFASPPNSPTLNGSFGAFYTPLLVIAVTP